MNPVAEDETPEPDPSQNEPASASESNDTSASESGTSSPEEHPVSSEAEASSATEAPGDEVARWKNIALRAQAELENYRKRMARDKAEAIKFGNAALLEDLLPIIDNFHFGLEAARQDSESSTVFQGLSMILKQMQDFLGDQGVVEVETLPGSAFDPNLHEAVKQDHSEEVAEGSILAVVRRGYRLNDRLLRAANVIVSKGPEPAGTPAPAPGDGTVDPSPSSEDQATESPVSNDTGGPSSQP